MGDRPTCCPLDRSCGATMCNLPNPGQTWPVVDGKHPISELGVFSNVKWPWCAAALSGCGWHSLLETQNRSGTPPTVAHLGGHQWNSGVISSCMHSLVFWLGLQTLSKLIVASKWEEEVVAGLAAHSPQSDLPFALCCNADHVDCIAPGNADSPVGRQFPK